MADLETAVRDALRSRAAEITTADLRRPMRDGRRPPRRTQWLLAAAAVLAVLAIAVPLTLLRGSGGGSGQPAAGSAAYVGWKWNVTSITDDQGRIDPPARLQLAIDFPAGGGHVGGNDGVNYCYGPMTVTGDGYDAHDIACTAAGYIGTDPVVLRSIAGIDSLFMLNSAAPVHVTATLAGDTLTLSAGGVTVTATRAEAEATAAPSESDTGSAVTSGGSEPSGPLSGSYSPGYSGPASAGPSGP